MDGQTWTDKQADRQPEHRHTDSRTTDRQTEPLNSSRFLEILRTNYREQISRLEIRELNLIIPVPVPEDGNGKIKELSLNPRSLSPEFSAVTIRPKLLILTHLMFKNRLTLSPHLSQDFMQAVLMKL